VIFHDLEHILNVPWVIQAALVAGLLLLFGGVLVRRRVATADGGVLPDDGITVRNLLEVLVDWLAGMAREHMGPKWRTYFPLVGTMFFFILISNLMGLIPGLAGSTSDVNTTAACAIIAWVVYTAIGIMEHKGKYLLKFMGPALGKHHIHWLAPFFIPLEIPLDFARIITLAVRLLANMFADHTVVAVWITLVPIAVPAVFMGLGLVVAFLQAFVFALLMMIYIRLALDEPH
jgi:F-type H+-transporting ATPase subunit a